MALIYPIRGVDSCAPPLELRLSHQERNRLAVARHIDKDPAAYREKCRQRDNARYNSDPVYREQKRQRRLLWHHLHGRRSLKLLYTPQELRDHLESLWLPGMTWENYGDRKSPNGWCIDHIKPVVEFTKAGITQPGIISDLSNLRPYWMFENNSKGAKPEPAVPTYPREKREYAGGRHHLAVLSEEDVKKIKARLKVRKYGTITALAREYGVHVGTIKMIEQGKTWKDVEPE